MKTTFIQAFQLNRFVKTHRCITVHDESDDNSRSNKIISMLKEKNGLANYFANYFMETDIPIVESLFDYVNELDPSDHDLLRTQPTVSATKNNNNEPKSYGIEFWQQKDIVLHTFKCLDLQSLNICSLISTNWMYLAFTPLSTIYLQINSHQSSRLFKAPNSRLMQRFTKIRRLDIKIRLEQAADSTVFNIMPKSTVLQALSIVPEIDICIFNRIKCNCISNLMDLICIHTKTLKALRVDLGSECKCFDINYINTQTDLGVIHLPKAEFIQWIGNAKNSFLPIVVSDVCQILDLECVDVDESWYQRIIEYNTFESNHSYSLPNLKSLILHNVQFPKNQTSINNIAKLFSGIKYLELGLVNDDMLNLLKSKEMKSVLIANNTQIFIAEGITSLIKHQGCGSNSISNDDYDSKMNIANVFKCLRDNGIKYHHYNDWLHSIPKLLHKRLFFSRDTIQTLYLICVNPKIFSWVVNNVFCNLTKNNYEESTLVQKTCALTLLNLNWLKFSHATFMSFEILVPLLDYVEKQQKSHKFFFEIDGTLRVLDETNNYKSVEGYIKQFFHKCAALINHNDAISIEFYIFKSTPKILNQIKDEIKKLNEIRKISSDSQTHLIDHEDSDVSTWYRWMLDPIISFEKKNLIIRTATAVPLNHEYPAMTAFINMNDCRWNSQWPKVTAYRSQAAWSGSP